MCGCACTVTCLMCVDIHRRQCQIPSGWCQMVVDTWHGCFFVKISKCSHTPSDLSSFPVLYIFETWSLSLYIPGWLGT